MASEEDLRVASVVVREWHNRYRRLTRFTSTEGECGTELARSIARVRAEARQNAWKEAIAVVIPYGAARKHAFGDPAKPSIMDALAAAAIRAGSSEAEGKP